MGLWVELIAIGTLLAGTYCLEWEMAPHVPLVARPKFALPQHQ